MGKNHKKRKGVNTSIQNREKVINIDFQNKSELIQFLEEHLAYQYKKSFKNLERTNRREFNRRIAQVCEFRKSLKNILWWRLLLFKKLNITNKSLILKIALKKAKISQPSEKAFSANVVYEIQGLNFKRIDYKG